MMLPFLFVVHPAMRQPDGRELLQQLRHAMNLEPCGYCDAIKQGARLFTEAT
jgi:hypothetical protein